MRKINWASKMKKDFNKVKRTVQNIESLLYPVIHDLAYDKVLPQKYRDHLLIGNWKGFRNCHIKSDLILVYRKQGEDTLELARLASHSELGF